MNSIDSPKLIYIKTSSGDGQIQNTAGFNPKTGEWNDSLLGDFLWDNTNIGEAIPNVMTPFTWSIFSFAYGQMNIIPGYHVVGNICGRPYQNGTAMYALIQALGKDPDEMIKEFGGGLDLPKDLTIPLISLPWQAKIPILTKTIHLQIKQRLALRKIPEFLTVNPKRCQAMRQRITTIETQQDFLEFWSELVRHTMQAFLMTVVTVWNNTETVAKLRRELEPMIGTTDTNTLLSVSDQRGALLASVAPVASLSKVARGEMARQAYLEQYGHRGPYEGEFSAPRPAEDPAWIDLQIAALKDSAINVDEMLASQQEVFNETWQRFTRQYPQKAKSIQRRLSQAREIHHQREAVRSESTRLIWVTRALALRAGEMTQVGEDIFYLTFEEMLGLINGYEQPVQYIPARKETNKKYCALPPFPRLISGHFDPFEWIANPYRSSEYFDSHMPDQDYSKELEATKYIKGNAGSAGIYEGIARVVLTAEEGHQLQAGEILVTNKTNVGWTLIFPRAGAVVTDVGAVLSHAAIVARELGIPAVVGCGDATAILKSGDRVRVDGGKGSVEILVRT